MISISIEGRWVGSLHYVGPDWEEELLGTSVGFNLKVERKGDGYVATYREDGAEPATTECNLDDDEVIFLVPPTDRSHDDRQRQRAVRFTGKYDVNTKAFIGDWEIGVLLPEYGPDFLDDISTGTWEMRRA